MVNNKRGAMMEVVIILVVAVAIAVIVIVFNQSSIGKVGSALSANDVGVIAAATGCSSELAAGPVDPQKKFCYEFKTIEKKSFLGFSTQLVNCEYLNNTIKTTISNADYYSEVTCPSSVWVEKCQLLLNENSGDASYEMLVNGKMCSKKVLNSEYKRYNISVYTKNATGQCVLESVAGTVVPVKNSLGADIEYYNSGCVVAEGNII